ncbi:MAG TPA: FAD/NAD(P)-binding oxidoreductase [Acidobacteriaceae bacterium]
MSDLNMSRVAEILVVGAGPAGLAAATTAAERGRNVIVLDDNPDAGGQIWRPGLKQASQQSSPEIRARTKAIAAFRRSGATLLSNRQVVEAREPGTLQALAGERIESFRWERLIIATGARERFLPFPGWTLPGVYGAGGLQALVKGGFSVHGKRIVVAGTGPLLLAVAAHLRQDGAQIMTVAEQAPWTQLLPFAASLWQKPEKLLQGTGYIQMLGSAPYRTGCWPVRANGKDSLTSVTLTDGNRQWTIECDALACGFHLVPNTELTQLLGCSLTDSFVSVNEQQQSSVEGIYCVGEPTGIAGVDAALAQGEIAGLAAAGVSDIPAKLLARRSREQSFGAALTHAFRLRPELKALAQAGTIVCRCEDVTFAQLKARSGWTDAKLHTRCGMGPCQGRICGGAVETLFGWRVASVRPPLFPIPVAAFCESGSDAHASTYLQETSS